MNADGLIKGSTYKFNLTGNDYCGVFREKKDKFGHMIPVTFSVNKDTLVFLVNENQFFYEVNSCESIKSQNEIESDLERHVYSRRPRSLTEEALDDLEGNINSLHISPRRRTTFKINDSKNGLNLRDSISYDSISNDQLGGRKSRSKRRSKRKRHSKRKRRARSSRLSFF